MPTTGQLPPRSMPRPAGAVLRSDSIPATPVRLSNRSTRAAGDSQRPVRVVAVVRNGVSSDLRVLKTCHLIQDAGFESCAVGWSESAEARFERHGSGVAIHRASAGKHYWRSLSLCHASLKQQLPLRQVIESEDVAWIQRNLGRLERCSLPVPAVRDPSATSARHVPPPGRSSLKQRVLGEVRGQVRHLGKFAQARAGGVLNSFLTQDQRDRLQARKMMVYLAATFWDLYPILIASDAELIHAHELSALLPAVVAARRLGVPVIYDSHELEFARNSPWSAETFALWTGHERDLIRFVDGIIAVSEGCALALRREYGLPEDSVTVVRNCPSERLEEPAQGLRQAVGLREDAPLLVFVGKITRNRGLELMLRVLFRLPHFYLACVGPEDSSYRESLEREASAAGVRERVFFLPPVAGNEVVPFISEADVSVMPIKDACLSYRYCLPNKLFESAHAGVPIVASALPDMQAFVDRYGIGTTVDGEDPERWALAIESVYQERASYFTPGKIARIRRESSAENEVAKVSALYRRVLAESVILPA